MAYLLGSEAVHSYSSVQTIVDNKHGASFGTPKSVHQLKMDKNLRLCHMPPSFSPFISNLRCRREFQMDLR